MTTAGQASAILLDGGRATRLGGAHKAFLVVDGRPVALRLLDACRSVADDVVVATARPEAWAGLPARTVADDVEGAGPLAGIAAGLRAVRHELAIVLAADMPRVSPAVLAALLELARGAPGRAVVPTRSGRPEPLHAVYPASLWPAAASALAAGVRRPADFLASVRTLWIPFEDLAHLEGASRTFDDIDTPGDLAGA